MATKLGLYNAALIEIGERTLSGLTENREPRRVLDAVYDSVLAECLAEGQWHFAERTVKITANTNVTIDFGYTYAFDIPTDYVALTGISSGEYIDDAPLLRYQKDNTYWYADIDPIYVRYISNDVEYGMNLLKWPATFTRYVEMALALRVVRRETQSNTDYERLEMMERRAKRNAKSKDAREKTVRFMPPGSWVQSRTSRLVNKRQYDRA